MIWKDWIEKTDREDLKLAHTMMEAGFMLSFSDTDNMFRRTSPDNIPHDAIKFHKDTIHVWKCYDGWQIAELVDGSYTKHRGSISYGKEGLFVEKFPKTRGYVPSLSMVLELSEKGEL